LNVAGDNTYLHLQAISALIYIAELQNDTEAFQKFKEMYFEMSNRSKLETMNEDLGLSSTEFESTLNLINEKTIEAFSQKN